MPEDVQEALRGAALARGPSLSESVLGEVEHQAHRTQVIQDDTVRGNAAVVRRALAAVGAVVHQKAVLSAGRDWSGLVIPQGGPL